METDYKDIYSRLILSNIKSYIKDNNIYLNNKEKMEKVDKIILKDIIKIFNDIIGTNKLNHKEKLNELFNSNDIIVLFMLEYTALYYDNLDLLKELLESGFYTNSTVKNNKLYALDNRLSNNFELVEYIKLVTNYNDLLSYFYNSLTNDFDDNEIIEKLCYIIKNKPNLLDELNTFNLTPIYFLNKKNLLSYDTNLIMNSTANQLDILNNLNCDEKTKKRILNLIENYNFNYQIIYWEKFFKLYTDKEILNLNKKQIKQICFTLAGINNANIKFIENKKVDDWNLKDIKKLRKKLDKRTRNL